MLAETDATTTPPPPDAVLYPQPGHAPSRQETKARRPLSRENLPDTAERRAPPPNEPERHETTRGEDQEPRNKTHRALRASLAMLLLASVAGGGYLYWDNASHYET